MEGYHQLMGRNLDLTLEQYRYLEKRLITSARKPRIARKVIGSSLGPIGFGKTRYDYDVLTDMGPALISMIIEEHEDQINIARSTVDIPILQKGFFIDARKLEASKSEGTPLNVSNGANAAYKVGLKEEALLIQGWAPDGTNYHISGMYQAAGLTEATAKDFGTAGLAIEKAQLTQAVMAAQDIYGPYDWLLHPTQYSQLSSYTANHNRTNRAEVEEIIGGQIYQTTSITAGTGLQIAAGRGGEMYDLIIAQDFISKSWPRGVQGLNFIGYECLVPLIYDANFAATMTGI
ncbi:encapsulin [Candidatus Pacearchaeota archaeon]|nr:encapsulin [Candidatus Pacearchaeota archaeon]